MRAALHDLETALDAARMAATGEEAVASVRGGGRGGRQRLERAGAGEGDEQAHPEGYAERGGGGRSRELVLGEWHADGLCGEANPLLGLVSFVLFFCVSINIP